MQINLPDPPFHIGVPVFGSVISPTEFQAALPHGIFKSVVPDPRRLEGSKAKHHTDLADVASLRSRVQRLVTGAKRKNVEPYARYIIEMKRTGEGFTPQIVLWTQQRLRVETDPQTGVSWALIPHSLKFIALDGDTQTTARNYAEELRGALFDDDVIKVTIKHGTREDEAQQIFADANSKGVKVPVSMAIGFDTRDDATLIAKDVERSIDFLRGRVNRQKRQLSKNDLDVITISALRGGTVCFIQGIGGVQNQNDGLAVPDEEQDSIRKATIMWFDAVINIMQSSLDPSQRADTFASAPAVWAAIGAIGHETHSQLVSADPEISENELAAAFARAAEDQLGHVDWNRNEKWLAAGAKRSSSGTITLGGPKETGSLVFKNLKEGSLKS